MRRQVCTVMASKRCWAVRTNEAKNGDVCLFLVMDWAHECRVLEAREVGLSKACQTHGFSTFFAINPYYFG